MVRIAIVGGGISGLTLAYRLEQLIPAAEVTVLESAPVLGGCVRTSTDDGFRLEWGPNGFLDNKPATLALCRELGLADDLIAASEVAARNRFLLLGGRLRILPSGLLSFLGSSALGWRGKLGLLTERWRRPLPEDVDESVDAFARRRVGAEIADGLADAFVTGIFAGDPKLLSLRSAFPRLAALEREHGSVVKGMSAARKQRRAEALGRGEGPPGRAKMWSFGEGLAKLIDSLREHLRRQPETGCSINGVVESPSPPRWRVSAADGRSWDADAVALTCPAYVQADLLREVDAALAAKIREIPYNRIAVVALGFRRDDVPSRLDGFGYLAPQTPPRDVLGVQWCSSIFPDRRAPKDAVLLRALCGGWRNPDIVDWDDVRLIAAVRAELTTTMRITSEPLFQRVVRWERAIPQYHVGHLDRVAGIELAALRHPGLFLGGNAYRGVAINDCVEQANMLAGRIRDWLADPVAST